MTSTTTDPTDELLDAVSDALRDAPASPSVIARRARVRTHEAHEALTWLVEHRMAVALGNGAWTNYRTRQFGETVCVQR